MSNYNIIWGIGIFLAGLFLYVYKFRPRDRANMSWLIFLGLDNYALQHKSRIKLWFFALKPIAFSHKWVFFLELFLLICIALCFYFPKNYIFINDIQNKDATVYKPEIEKAFQNLEGYKNFLGSKIHLGSNYYDLCWNYWESRLSSSERPVKTNSFGTLQKENPIHDALKEIVIPFQEQNIRVDEILLFCSKKNYTMWNWIEKNYWDAIHVNKKMLIEETNNEITLSIEQEDLQKAVEKWKKEESHLPGFSLFNMTKDIPKNSISLKKFQGSQKWEEISKNGIVVWEQIVYGKDICEIRLCKDAESEDFSKARQIRKLKNALAYRLYPRGLSFSPIDKIVVPLKKAQNINLPSGVYPLLEGKWADGASFIIAYVVYFSEEICIVWNCNFLEWNNPTQNRKEKPQQPFLHSIPMQRIKMCFLECIKWLNQKKNGKFYFRDMAFSDIWELCQEPESFPSQNSRLCPVWKANDFNPWLTGIFSVILALDIFFYIFKLAKILLRNSFIPKE